MKFPTAKRTLERRQAHLLRRINESPNKRLTHDVNESAAISCVLFEIKKLQTENEELKKPEEEYYNGGNKW
jgi:hypothetical protein